VTSDRIDAGFQNIFAVNSAVISVDQNSRRAQCSNDSMLATEIIALRGRYAQMRSHPCFHAFQLMQKGHTNFHAAISIFFNDCSD
jgi:hypothetical protein